MNRAERRAIAFGRAFSELREDYHLAPFHRPFVGIDAELELAHLEMCRDPFFYPEHCDMNWIESEIMPFRY